MVLGWWGSYSNDLLLSYYGYDFDAMNETERFRNNIIKLGITSMSAGSKTDPGGYASSLDALEQFEISDDRSPEAIVQMLKEQGYEAVWKDWELMC